jgi:hypothetical protein
MGLRIRTELVPELQPSDPPGTDQDPPRPRPRTFTMSSTRGLIRIKLAPPLGYSLVNSTNRDTRRHRTLGGVHRQTSCESLSPPSVQHRLGDRRIGPKQRTVVAAEHLWNEPGQLLSHAGGCPQRAELAIPSPFRNCVSVSNVSTSSAPRTIRQSDTLRALRGEEKGWSIAELHDRPAGHAQS